MASPSADNIDRRLERSRPTLAERPPSVLNGVPTRLCEHGHPNDVDNEECFVCRLPLDATSPIVEAVPEPVAQLILDDGSGYRLEAETFLGRAPGDETYGIVVDGPEISRKHLVISARGWRLVVRDLNSANGTYLHRLGARARRRVPTDRNVALAVGDQLYFGGRRASVVPVLP